MAQNFNIATIFTAVDRLSAPMRQISAQMRQFATTARGSSSSAAAGLNTADQAAHTLHRDLSAINRITFSAVSSRLRGLSEQVRNMSRGFRDAGNTALGAGFAGIAAGYGLNQTLEPVREAQRASNQLGVVYGQGKSVSEQQTIGKQQYQVTAELATKLPGAVAGIADFRAFSKRYGVEGNYDLIKGFTDALGVMGKATLDNEVLASIQSIMIGNQSDIFEKTGLKAFTDKKTHEIGLRDLATKQEFFFKTDAERLQFLSKFLSTKYAGGTELAMKSLVGRESNAGDALNAASVSVWEESGALAVYNQKLAEFTDAVTALTPKVTNLIKPIAEWMKNNKELFNTLLLGIPALLGLGIVLKTVGFALSGFGFIISSVTGTLSALRAIMVGIQAATTLFTAATGLAVAPVLALVAGLVGLGAAAYAVVKNWNEISAGFQQMKAKVTADFAAWKLPTLDFSGIWEPLKAFFSETLNWITATWSAFGLPTLDFSGIWDGLLSGFVKVINTIKSIWASLPSFTAPGVPAPKQSGQNNVTPMGAYAKQKVSSNLGIYSKQEAGKNPQSIYSKPDYLKSKAPVVNLHQSIQNKSTPTGIQTTTKTSSPGLNIKLNAGVNQRGAK